jgi:4-hydroxybenzoate polyprenyltransferase
MIVSDQIAALNTALSSDTSRKTPASPETGLQPLCVDLDGTLIRCDTLIEGVFRVLRDKPSNVIRILRRAFSGIPALKREVARCAPLDPATLPYNPEFLDYLCQEKLRGRPLFLVTGADRSIAEAVANHLGIFDGVLATVKANLTGENKATVLFDLFGNRFAYAGNSAADLPCWRVASERILVNAPAAVTSRVDAECLGVVQSFPKPNRFRATLRAMRLHQWAKNILLFAPLLASRHALNLNALFLTTLGAIAMSLVASAVYLTNDIWDIDTDRKHRTKMHRPFASGQLSIIYGLVLAVVFAASGLFLAGALGQHFLQIVVGYSVTSVAYSVYFKKQLIQDVLVLAGLYTIRVFAGGVVAGITVSTWLLAFALFLFLSLAFLKRYADLIANSGQQGRGYISPDTVPIAIFGGSSALLASLVLVLYVSSPQVTKLYSNPDLLWLVCPLLIYWMARAWVLAGRGKMNLDPVIFALRDPAGYVVVALVVLLGWLAG